MQPAFDPTGTTPLFQLNRARMTGAWSFAPALAEDGAATRRQAYSPRAEEPRAGAATVRRPAPRTPSRVAQRRILEAASDLELLRHVLSGEPAAFEVFQTRFHNLIVACSTRVAARSGQKLQESDLADIVAEVSLNMVGANYRRLRLYREDGGCSVSSWVGVIASSTTHDFIRRERRRRLDPMLDTEMEKVLPPVDGPDRELIDRQERAFVDSALSRLSKRDRRFVELYFSEAMSPDDIAKEMKVSLSTVYSKKAKIKLRLQSLAKLAA